MTSQIYIAVTIVVLAVIALLMVFVRKGKSGKETRLSPLAGLAFGFILAGLFFGEKRSIGYGLLGVGVLLAVIDMFKKLKSK